MRLIHGDTTDKSTLEKESIHVTICSPPYNIGMQYKGYKDTIPYDEYLNFSRQWLSNVLYWTKPGGRLLCNIALHKAKGERRPLSPDVLQAAMSVGWKYQNHILWHEGNIPNRAAWGSWLSSNAPNVMTPVESILVLYKDEYIRSGGTPTISKEEFIKYTYGVWTFNGARKNGHVAPFPRELPKRLLKLYTFKEDIILDCFMGSGTTGIECIQQQRNFIGIEKYGEYYELSKRKIEAFKRQTSLIDY